MHDSLDAKSQAYERLHSLVVLLIDFKRQNVSDHKPVLAFLNKMMEQVSGYLNADPNLTYQAKMIIRKHYIFIDSSFIFNVK